MFVCVRVRACFFLFQFIYFYLFIFIVVCCFLQPTPHDARRNIVMCGCVGGRAAALRWPNRCFLKIACLIIYERLLVFSDVVGATAAVGDDRSYGI